MAAGNTKRGQTHVKPRPKIKKSATCTWHFHFFSVKMIRKDLWRYKIVRDSTSVKYWQTFFLMFITQLISASSAVGCTLACTVGLDKDPWTLETWPLTTNINNVYFGSASSRGPDIVNSGSGGHLSGKGTINEMEYKGKYIFIFFPIISVKMCVKKVPRCTMVWRRKP